MTREEQISDAAQICDIDCFVAGAEWADSHPHWHKYPEDPPPQEEDHHYLVIDKIGVYTMAEYVDNQDGQGYHFRDLFDPEEIYDYSIKDQDVVVWKELPQPPEFD